MGILHKPEPESSGKSPFDVAIAMAEYTRHYVGLGVRGPKLEGRVRDALLAADFKLPPAMVLSFFVSWFDRVSRGLPR